MDRIDATKARESFSDTIDRVRYTGQRVMVRKHGKDVAAIVPLSDLAAIEAMEDRRDADAARAVLRDPKTVFIPYADARKTLGRKAAGTRGGARTKAGSAAPTPTGVRPRTKPRSRRSR